ncbi:MAG: dicarboxylate/amino acid:cation symporter [Planctomycetota bacterium]
MADAPPTSPGPTPTPRKTRGLALHWQILIGLGLGIVVGVIVNLAWGPGAWNGLGVEDPGAFLAKEKSLVLPDGQTIEGIVAALPEGELRESLQGRPASDLTKSEAESIDLRFVNHDAGFGANLARFVRNFNGFIGDLFMRCLRFIAVPIVLFSLIVGASSLNDIAKLSRIGGKTIGIYLATTALAITVGLVVANVVRPGTFVNQDTRDRLVADYEANAEGRVATAQERREGITAWGQLLNLIPTNPFAALSEGRMLQVVVLALLIGIALSMIPEARAGPVIRFSEGMTDTIIKLVELLMKTAPYAVFALIVKVVADLGLDVLGALIVYSICVVGGLLVMALGVYPLVLKIFTGVNPGRFYRAIAPAQLLAFSSASSGATLPVTMECVEKRLGVSEEVTSFVVPLGATINMDGTALYQGVAALFIAQLFNMNLDLGQQLTIVGTTTLASIGTAAVPGAGTIMLVIVLQSVGVPLEGIAAILGVDRLLDMCRTSCNVTGDAMVAAVVGGTEGELASADEVEKRQAEEERRGLDEWPGRD